MNSKAHILIVEDDGVIAADLQEILLRAGYVVTPIATSGEKAIQCAAANPPDVIFMDINLPGDLDGIDTAARIQAAQNIPIIYLSAFSNQYLLERGKTTGPFGYLPKPFDEQQVYVTLEMALYKHQMEQALQETNRRLAQEILERKAAEEELVTARDELELRVRERTAELAHANQELQTYRNHLEDLFQERTAELQQANRQLAREIGERQRAEMELQQAKEAAEQANHAKSEFLTNMSHELRTPFNAVLGYAQLLMRDESLTAQQRDPIHIIQQSGEHLLSMINEILDLTKIEARRIELEPAEFHLPGMLRSIGDMVQIRAYRKGLKFISEIAPDIPLIVQGDEKRLRQILLNLLSNAVKFTKQGKVTLRVSSIVNCQLHFQVEDTGIGIPSDYLSTIFLPFERVRDERYHAEGTGLGLSISRHLVRMMGGELAVNSTPGQGSIFWFEIELPVIVSSEAEAARQKSFKTSTSPTIVGFKGRPRKILIADDNTDSRLVFKAILSSVGFETFEANDGRDTIEKAKSFQPDAILMDLMIPEMDGFEATRHIRRIPELQQIVIIAISAHVFDHSRRDSFQAGCHDFITKPLSSVLLFDTLQKHLQLEWVYAEEHAPQTTATAPEPPMIPPPPEYLKQLHEFALIGDILEIRNLIEKIAQLDEKFEVFVAKMWYLAKDLKVTEIQEFVEQFLAAANYKD